ncbi:DNA-binding protein RFX2 isoform X1 [Drosophila gunungcola]|uniref:DNA-binding protein RFX2 isoform X1 n=1 Tax=Drosophila gunungcola TaxID=103775 RepID=UPI0022E251A9|nr:DNA-binding protein RFX2 isoform X1 [Drosophila gunungcola]
MTTRLAPQRQFIISTRSAIANATSVPDESSEEQQQLTVEVESATTNPIAASSTNSTTSPPHAEQFEFCTEDGVVVSATLEDVMTQVKLLPLLQNCQLLQKKLVDDDEDSTGAGTTSAEQLEVIRVVLPMDADDSSSEAHLHGHVVNSSSETIGTITTTEPNGTTVTHSIPIHSMADLAAIKDGVDLAQQVASGQVTVVQATEDDDGTPFITVTVSGQEQNYQVQYVDSELYHSNSSQTQMTYPFCPVGDYQGNGQTAYYSTSTGQYGATSSAGGSSNGAHSTTLPYLVPVEEGILLNGSAHSLSQSHSQSQSQSQSHGRDSPHSLTVSSRDWERDADRVNGTNRHWVQEVAYIQEAQSTPQTPTSTTTTHSASGGSLGTGGGGASPDSDQSALGSSNKIASATIKWLSRNYETADGVSLPRSTLYNHYMQHCSEHKLEPVNAASFGKLIRSVFSGLRTRRLGTRGNSKYHYYGIRIKPGSLLNSQTMDDKQMLAGGYGASQDGSGAGGPGSGALVSVTSSTAGQLGGSNGHGHGGGGQGQRHSGGTKKHTFKPETYEACIQFIGDGSSALPSFPAIELNHSFNSELTLEDVDTFRALYREHCESFLDAVLNLEFNTVEFLLRDFWRASDNNNLDECEEEKYLSKTKLYLLCHCAEVQKFVREVDYQFYQNTVDVIIPDVLRSIPNALTQAIRNFAKNLEIWLCESMLGVPEQLAQIKTSAVSAFCQTLRRYTSLNHLAQAARAVLQNGAQISQMLSDLNRVDFHNVQEQAAWVSQCAPAVVQRLENDFKAALQQQSSLEQWASWLQLVVESAMEEYNGKPTYARAARQFLLKWSFYSSMIIRDLTLRSASSFGSFHLIRLLFDEYMFYLVEHKIAEAQDKTAIAVICERMKKDMDFEFECQFAYITSDTEQQTTPSSASSGGDVGNVANIGNEAKRLKQE